MFMLKYLNNRDQPRYISSLSVCPPAKVSYSSSERVVDALGLPYAVALGLCDMLNHSWDLSCDIVPVSPITAS